MRVFATDLSARRGEDLVFTGISVALDAGDALVVTGPNGIGKSTFLRLLAGLLEPAAGRICFEDGEGRAARLCEHAHYLGHRDAMKRELTVRDNLAFWQRHMAGGPHRPGRPVAEAAAAVGLREILHLPFGYLSAGQQRRIAMARLLVTHRPVWLLDEPTGALDAASEALFADLVAQHRAGGGIVVAATHRPLGLDAAARLDMAAHRPAEPVPADTPDDDIWPDETPGADAPEAAS